MKKIQKHNTRIFALLLTTLILFAGRLSAQQDSATGKELVSLKYFSLNNSVQYLELESILKTGKIKTPLPGKAFQLYLDNNKPENFIAAIITDKTGKARCFLPPTLKTGWESASLHKFIAIVKDNEEPAAELEITKSKIEIDTASESGAKNIIVKVSKFESTEWKPAAEVEMKVGIKRFGGILSAGDEETYTTDSSGSISVAVTKNNLPGDAAGNIILVAKAEDNDLYGNLQVEKKVGWGVAIKSDNTFFDQRTLWSTRFKTPIWLLFMAYSIVITVWSTIIYLVFQVLKIKKAGA